MKMKEAVHKKAFLYLQERNMVKIQEIEDIKIIKKEDLQNENKKNCS